MENFCFLLLKLDCAILTRANERLYQHTVNIITYLWSFGLLLNSVICEGNTCITDSSKQQLVAYLGGWGGLRWPLAQTKL